MCRYPRLKWLLVSGVIWFVALSSGCSINAQFVDAVDDAWSTIGPRYIDYVDKDPLLSGSDKETRIRTATLLTVTIGEAKDE